MNPEKNETDQKSADYRRWNIEPRENAHTSDQALSGNQDRNRQREGEPGIDGQGIVYSSGADYEKLLSHRRHRKTQKKNGNRRAREIHYRVLRDSGV
jgi:hypothetical protein